MGITCTGGDRAITISLTGEVDHHRAREMMTLIDREMDRMLPKAITLDLGGVSFMDSSGIAVVLRCHKRVRELGGTMAVCGVPEQAGKVLRAAGLDKLMTFE